MLFWAKKIMVFAGWFLLWALRGAEVDFVEKYTYFSERQHN